MDMLVLRGIKEELLDTPVLILWDHPTESSPLRPYTLRTTYKLFPKETKCPLPWPTEYELTENEKLQGDR